MGCNVAIWSHHRTCGVIIAQPLASTHGIFGPRSTECALPAAGLIIALVASNRQGHSTSECAWYFVA